MKFVWRPRGLSAIWKLGAPLFLAAVATACPHLEVQVLGELLFFILVLWCLVDAAINSFYWAKTLEPKALRTILADILVIGTGAALQILLRVVLLHFLRPGIINPY